MSDPPRLLDQVRVAVRTRHYSRRTEDAYLGWTKRFILLHRKRHPAAMGAEEVNAFLSHLAVEGNVSASTQAQALSALVFLYRHVLDDPLPWLDEIVRARRTRKLPVVLSREEVGSLLGAMSGTSRHIAAGCGDSVRRRTAAPRGAAAEDQGHRLWSAAAAGSGRERGEGPPDHAPGQSAAGAARSDGNGATDPSRGSRRRRW